MVFNAFEYENFQYVTGYDVNRQFVVSTTLSRSRSRSVQALSFSVADASAFLSSLLFSSLLFLFFFSIFFGNWKDVPSLNRKFRIKNILP